MIGRLTGKIVSKKPNLVLLNVGGVGYRIHVPLSTYFSLSDSNERAVSLEICTCFKENAIHLYGFLSNEEKELFEKLISVSGIGPKLSLNIMSGVDFNDLVHAIISSDTDKLRSIPGVGRKMAERIVLELRDKMEEISGRELPGEQKRPMRIDRTRRRLMDDTRSALINLGFRLSPVRKVVERALQKWDDRSPDEDPTFEYLFKEALKELMKR